MSGWQESLIVERIGAPLAELYFEWALATNFAYYGKAEWLPVLFELKATPRTRGTAQEFAALVAQMQQRAEHEQEWAADLRVPDFFARPPARLRTPIRFLAAFARRALLEAVYAGQPPAEHILRFEIGRAAAYNGATLQLPATRRQPLVSTAQPAAVVTAVIDDGIAFANQCLFSADGTTRVEYLWDQVEPLTFPGWGPGRELTKRHPTLGIDRRLSDSRHGALVDEDEVYRRSRFVDQTRPGHKALAARSAHGAHVTDLTRYPLGRPAPGTRPIVAVQLPVATVEDTSGATLSPQIFLGLAYVLVRADAIASDAGMPQLPVVVNLSYGLIAGPHDGSSLLEQAMDQIIASCNSTLRIVLPAGNSHLSRCHARFSIAPGAAQELGWRVLPDDWTESHVEIWLPAGGGSLTVTITAPDGRPTTPFTWATRQDLLLGQNIVGQAQYLGPGLAGKHALVRLTLAPTASPQAGVPLAPAGLWRIELDNPASNGTVNDVHAWIQRDDTAPGYTRRGRQSYFDDPAYRRHDDGGRPIEVDDAASYVKRQGTLNAIATGSETLVIGGYRRSDGRPAPYSASGPLVAPGRGAPTPNGPDAMFPSEDAPSHYGLLAAGTRSGIKLAMNGTSVAAPLGTHWAVEEAAAGRPNDRHALYAAATTKDGMSPSQPAPERGGGGRMDAPPTRPPP